MGIICGLFDCYSSKKKPPAIPIDSSNGEFRLPEETIQHIQSFLSGKEAAQTSILSKSWYNAWLTRPNLDFNQKDFERDNAWFLEHGKKTLQRYEDSNLKVESFSLCMISKEIDWCTLGDDLTLQALKLGATDLFLSICLDLKYSDPPSIFDSVECCNIKILSLEWLYIDPLFSDDSSIEFPFLKVLTLRRCFSKKGYIRIRSPSLERISFVNTHVWGATFDVPSIRKFTFSDHDILPSLAFERASDDWVSDLSIGGECIKTSWFLKLEKFLEDLSRSRIFLSLKIGEISGRFWFNCARDKIQCLSRPVVKNLTVKRLGCYKKFIKDIDNVLGYLFLICEPNFITQYWEDLQWRGWRWITNKTFLRVLCKNLMLHVNETDRTISSLQGLEEVNVECFEETLAKWRPLSLKTLLDASTISLNDKQLVRFRLKWA